MTVREKSMALAALVLVLTARTAAQPTDLKQGWYDGQKDQFWFTSQGSRLLPYSWFLNLEQATSTMKFRDPENMRRLGYIPTAKSTRNQDALPIGFAKDTAKNGGTYVGLTCAACHTTVVNINHSPVIVEGAPALADFWLFLTDLVNALDATRNTPEKLATFLKATGATAQELTDVTDDIRTRWLSLPPPTPYGPGRLDAFGGLYNQVVAYDIGAPANARVADAPVSYPFLWDTPQHKKVQWNGSATNNLGHLGALFRNIGEALGVFGCVEVAKAQLQYTSSIRVHDLGVLENRLLRKLRSPVWPDTLPKPDPAAVAEGRELYKLLCVSCHTILKNPSDPNRHAGEQMVDANVVGTDLTMAVNYVEKFQKMDGVETGVLNGSRSFGPRASGGEVFANVILGSFLGAQLGGKAALSPLAAPPQTFAAADNQALHSAPAIAEAQRIKTAIRNLKLEYKARPLNGVWATAPFLHNGSVPTVWELLQNPATRTPQFYVGSRDFDAKDLGLSTDKVDGAFLFDTSKPGNSNQGHPYGTSLKEPQKRALMEFLKLL